MFGLGSLISAITQSEAPAPVETQQVVSTKDAMLDSFETRWQGYRATARANGDTQNEAYHMTDADIAALKTKIQSSPAFE